MRILTHLTVLVMLFSLTGCLTFAKNETLQEVKAEYDCINYKEGITWTSIKDIFNGPDKAPLPQSGQKLSQNARIYDKKTVIFYVESSRYEENGKTRYREAVKSVELCKKK